MTTRPLPTLALATVLSAALFSGGARAETDAGARADVVATSRVAAVVVYPGAAIVERAVEAALPRGAASVVVEGLPVGLDPATLSATGEGAFTIEGVEVRTSHTPGAASPRAKELEERIASIEEQIGVADEEISNIEETRKFLSRLGEIQRNGANRELEAGRLPAAEIASMSTSFGQSLRDLSQRLLEARRGRRGLVRDLDAARRELREIHQASGRQTVAAVVSVSAREAGRAAIRLRYLVQGASWEPAYDARADLDRGELRLSYAAMVRQSTGEDWSNVDLTLSTARPSIGASVSDPSPWWLEPRPQMPTPIYRTGAAARAPASVAMAMEVPEPAEELAYDMAGGAPAAPPPAEVATAEIAAGVNASFKAPARATVLSDNRPRKVLLVERAFPSQFRHRAVPMNAERAYVAARFPNATEALFLAGEVYAYQGADFVGRGRVATVAPGDTFEVQLGADPSIEVRREEVERRVDPSTGFGGGGRVRHLRKARIVLENHRRAAVTLDVLDRYPVSRNDEIRVERDRPSLAPAETRDDGVVRWEVTLAPGEKRTIEFGYRVEHPQGMEIIVP